MEITKQQAAILYGYNYLLIDSEGIKYRICEILEREGLMIRDINPVKKHIKYFIELKEIGTDYQIIGRPTSDLTKPLEDGKIPIVELAKIAYDDDWMLHIGAKRCMTQFGKGFEYDFPTRSFHLWEAFDIHYTPNQLQLFQYLYENHFAIGLPEGTWIDVSALSNETKR